MRDIVDEVANGARERAAARRRNARLRTAFTILAVTISVAVGVVLVVHIPSPRPRMIAGTVHCDSGARVQGVWVGSSNFEGAFAKWTPRPADPSTASFEIFVTTTAYVVHVGCGGSGQNWSVEGQSPYVEAEATHLICLDRKADHGVATCVVRAP